jgi:hypothetical protein
MEQIAAELQLLNDQEKENLLIFLLNYQMNIKGINLDMSENYLNL